MAGHLLNGLGSWTGGDRDKEGHRTYKLQLKIGHGPKDGPATLAFTPGLPVPGAFWDWGNDVDSYAFCWWAYTIKPEVADEPNTVSTAEFTFSTRPENKFCRTQEVENPLLEPPKVSGSFSKYTEEATRNLFGVPITNSAWEQIRGPHNEWDKNRLSIKIEQNVGTPELGYILPAQFMDCVNAFPLWGFPPRTVKLSSAPWEAKFWGSCAVYYTRTLDFEIRWTTLADGSVETWDRDLMDEGTSVLNGHLDPTTRQWILDNIGGNPPNPNNPLHFIKFLDAQGNVKKVPLNGRGVPAGTVGATAPFFVSRSAGNAGNPLGNAGAIPWSLVAGDPANVQPFDLTFDYVPGSLVTYNGSVWVMDFVGDFLAFPSAPLWKQLSAPPLVNKGVWSVSTTYALGDYVIDGSSTVNVGKIHIAKYPGVNLELLDIPLSF